MNDEERDLREFKEAMATAERSDIAPEEQLKAAIRAVDICAKYDALAIQDWAKRHLLDALQAPERIAANSDDPETRQQARKDLEFYNRIIFPPGSGA